jgi:hypothetical protein
MPHGICNNLALRSPYHRRAGLRSPAECIADRLVPGRVYSFEKLGHKKYPAGEIPLRITEGESRLTGTIAFVRVYDVRYGWKDGALVPRGATK